MKRLVVSLLVMVLLAPLIAEGQGASFRTERGNIYSAGGSIAIADDAENDIVAAGGDVSISGSAANEVLAAGGSIVLSGRTGGDARMAGGNLTVAGTIGGEAVLGGGKIALLPKSRIASGLIAAGGDITIDGVVDGSARIMAGTVTINGAISRDADIKAERIVIGKNAKIGGNLRYEAPREAEIAQGAAIAGETVFRKAEYEQPRQRAMKFLGAWWVLKLLAVLTAALVIFLVLPERTAEVTGLGVDRFGRELLVGFLVFVAVPVVIVLLFIIAIGSLLALVTLLLYMAFLLLSTVFGALIFIRLVSVRVFKRTGPLTWQLVAGGVVLYQVLGLIPFLGWLFKFVFFLTALGALSNRSYSLGGRPRPKPGAQSEF